MGFLRAFDLGDAFADQGLGDDQLRLAAAGGLGALECRIKGIHLVTIDGLHVEADGLEALGRIFTLGGLGHGI